jgi:hypothetical protein
MEEGGIGGYYEIDLDHNELPDDEAKCVRQFAPPNYGQTSESGTETWNVGTGWITARKTIPGSVRIPRR